VVCKYARTRRTVRSRAEKYHKKTRAVSAFGDLFALVVLRECLFFQPRARIE